MNLETLKIGTVLSMINRNHPNGYQSFTYLGKTIENDIELLVVQRGTYWQYLTKEDFIQEFEVSFESEQDPADVLKAESNILLRLRDNILTGKFY